MSTLTSWLCSGPFVPSVENSTVIDVVSSTCFTYVLVPITPAVLSPLVLIFLLAYGCIFTSPKRIYVKKKLTLAKLTISIANYVLALIGLIIALEWSEHLMEDPKFYKTLMDGKQNLVQETYELKVGRAIDVVFGLFSLASYILCIRSGIRSSGLIHLLWFLRLISLIPQTVLVFYIAWKNVFQVGFLAFLIDDALFSAGFLLCAILLVILFCWADKLSDEEFGYQRLEPEVEEKDVFPDSDQSVISSFFFTYASRLLWKGLKGTVGYADLWAFPPWSKADYLRDRFYETGDLKKVKHVFALFWRLVSVTWYLVAPASVFVIFIVICRYMNAFFLRIIVLGVSSKLPTWVSITALVCIFMIDFTGKLLTTRRDFYSFLSYVSVRSILVTTIYDKSIRLSSAAKSRYSAGEVLNLITTDVQRLREFWFDIRDLIYCPFMVFVAFIGLYFELGWNVAFGVGILFAVLPINYGIAKLMARLEQSVMKIKDERMKLMNDVLSGIRVLKLYAWEPSMRKMIAKLRGKETTILWKLFIVDNLQTISFQLAPIFATLASFYGYSVIQQKPLTPDVAFVSILLFSMLRFAIYEIPVCVTVAIKAFVSGGRILKFLNEEEHQRSHIKSPDAIVNGIVPPDVDAPLDQPIRKPIVVLDNCSFTWGSINSPESSKNLSSISLNVFKGELVGIVGKVGSGKSSLLSAILGDMSRFEDGGSCSVIANSLGYAPQQPWIQNKTLRDNILFGKPFDEALYQKTIEATALADDIALLPAGDLTEIGEKGINLSGGQKARAALARAVYQQADLYILDDTLSAVDSHVGAQIFNKAIGPKGLIGKTTRIFALNTLPYLHFCDRIIVMHEGRIHQIGTLNELKQNREGPFADLMREYFEKKIENLRKKSRSSAQECENSGINNADALTNELVGSPLGESILELTLKDCGTAGTSQGPTQPDQDQSTISNTHQIRRRRRSQSRLSSSSFFDSSSITSAIDSSDSHLPHPPISQAQNQQSAGQLIEEEELATGAVPFRVYKDFCRAFGWIYALGFLIFMFLGMSLLDALANIWLANWTSKVDKNNHSLTDPQQTVYYLAWYSAFEIGTVLSILIWGMLLAKGAYNASVYLHDALVDGLFHAPAGFFQRTPLGRIINRLSSDIDRIDENVPILLAYTLMILATALSAIVAIVVVIPALSIVAIPLLILAGIIMHFYNVSSVQFRRLTTKAWSKTCSYIQDSYQGADSIRAYSAVERFRVDACCIINGANESVVAENVVNRWIQNRMDILTDSAVFIFMLVAILLADKGAITAGVLAMVISSGFSFTGFLGEIARLWRETNSNIVAVERITEYINLEIEGKWRISGIIYPGWPSQGQIVFREFSLRYRPDLEPVLHDLTFEISSREKVGIVGRTGAGKTSMTIALFRLVEPYKGQIFIDGIDITTIGLHDLREALTIIPQDPVLFCGTLRSNLDPFEQFSDDAIWSALEKAHLSDTVRGFSDNQGLRYEISEAGGNLSVGQRQLVCLARALLRHTKVLILDEATASIDVETDRLIQRSIRENFNECTILTIAHRLNTVLDYDRILVLDAGRVIEFDSPKRLLEIPDSAFSVLAKHAGITGISASSA